MNILTIYTNKFDQGQDVVNGGMSGKVFLDMDGKFGKEFKSLDEAFDYFLDNNIQIHRIDFNYLAEDNYQMFVKYNVTQ